MASAAHGVVVSGIGGVEQTALGVAERFIGELVGPLLRWLTACHAVVGAGGATGADYSMMRSDVADNIAPVRVGGAMTARRLWDNAGVAFPPAVAMVPA